MSFEYTPDQLDDNYFMTDSPLGRLSFDTEIHPFKYLQFAREDLDDGDNMRHLINAISNAKRALHLQVETIANGFGMKVLRKRSNFPKKLAFLKDLGIVTPSIIYKINQIRNKVEHDYATPSLEETKDFVDIVELFLQSTAVAINTFPDYVYFESSESYQREEQGLPPAPPTRPIDMEVTIKASSGKINVSGKEIDIVSIRKIEKGLKKMS